MSELQTEPQVYFRTVTRPEAAALLAISAPKLRLSAWVDPLNQIEVARYRKTMDAGSWPDCAGVVMFDTSGALMGGREILEAFSSSQLGSVTVTIITGLSVGAGEYL